MLRRLAISFSVLCLSLPCLFLIQSSSPVCAKSYTEKEAKYLYKIQKEDAKEEYGRKKNNRTPSGYMTVEEYEMLSAPIDKTQAEIPIPKPHKAADMKYIPHPDYEIVRYNNPPGSPEISLGRNFKKTHQQNAQGIVSPDYRILVYPAVYYYPRGNTVACDLFVIPLEPHGNALAKIKKANVMHRDPNPILSTEKSIENYAAFMTLTPVDFSTDGQKLLVKEKIGSSEDGIWQTNAIVYDFNTKSSYKLNEVRDAIEYYWFEYKNLNLKDVRWDIYPLGFDANEPGRIVVSGYAYTGEVPVFLGNWSVDTKGEQVRMLSLKPKDVQVSMNGVKMVQSGVVPPMILEVEEKQARYEDKLDAKAAKEKEKAELKKLKEEYKNKLQEIEKEHSYLMEDYRLKNKIEGSTSTNDSVEDIEQALLKHKADTEAKEAKKKAREAAKEQKRLEKEKRKQQKGQSVK